MYAQSPWNILSIYARNVVSTKIPLDSHVDIVRNLNHFVPHDYFVDRNFDDFHHWHWYVHPLSSQKKEMSENSTKGIVIYLMNR